MGGAAPRSARAVGPVTGTVHVVGAGIAGLAAATWLSEAGARVRLYDRAPMAGGRCRSFDDPVLGTTVDNGTHVLLGANNAALDYVRRIGAHDRLQVHAARFPFLDATSGQRWTLDLDRALPVLAPIPGVKFTHRLDVLRRLLPLLLRSGQRRRLAEVIGDNHPLAAKLLAPFVTATLNTEPDQADARLALATLARCVIAGRQGFTLHTVAESLDDTFIAPALAMLAAKGAQIDLGCAVNALDIRQNRVHALVTDGEPIPITRDDTVILAVPATAVAALLGEAAVPNRFHAIVNAHYRLGQEQAPSAGDSFVAGCRRHRAMGVSQTRPRLGNGQRRQHAGAARSRGHRPAAVARGEVGPRPAGQPWNAPPAQGDQGTPCNHRPRSGNGAGATGRAHPLFQPVAGG